jgi:hypothetical protein
MNKVLKDVIDFTAKFGINEAVETLGENLGFFQTTRDTNGKVLKRKLFGIGPEDEHLYAMAFVRFFKESGLMITKDELLADKTLVLRLDAALDQMERWERDKIKAIIGLRETEFVISTREIPIKSGKKGQNQDQNQKSEKIVEKTYGRGNEDGKDIIHLFASVMYIAKKVGEDEAEELKKFIRGHILISFSERANEAVSNVNNVLEKIHQLNGTSREQLEIQNLRRKNRIADKQTQLLAMKARRLGIPVDELLATT